MLSHKSPLGSGPRRRGTAAGGRPGRTALFVSLALAIVSGSWLATGPAAAYTAATNPQRAALERVVHARWLSEVPPSCPAAVGGPTVFHLRWARVSSIYPQYAFVSVRDDGCTFTMGYFLRRATTRSDRWRVVSQQADSAQPCSDFRSLPGPVLNEFGIEGTRGSQGVLRLCGRTTGAPWCDQFGVSYAVNTTCAVEEHVARLYRAECIPRSYRSGPLPWCRRSLAGFSCIPSGDAYAVVNCVDGRRRVGLHLAE
jgi:hypothetical protein